MPLPARSAVLLLCSTGSDPRERTLSGRANTSSGGTRTSAGTSGPAEIQRRSGSAGRLSKKTACVPTLRCPGPSSLEEFQCHQPAA